ncbi:ABC transporter substrate-binding protein [Gemella massiliensis]|uniref:ABC transporter substrate-binding protein n=1 Tax=Gemella massiliensis TaxID=1909670 RepID=UPI0009315547|nr:ABC transporter substrate-binding protein [Gemella massiliensis]
MKKNMLKVFSSTVALSLVLAGCSTSQNKKTRDETKPAVEFKTSVDNGGNTINNGHLKIGILSADPLTGMFNPIFFLQATDYYIMRDTMLYTFALDKDYRLKQDDGNAPAKFHLDKDKKEATVTLRSDLKWNNGQDVTADDIVATYHLMGNPKYVENIRYSEDYEVIEGMKEYHNGKVDSISGITKKDNKTVVIKYTEVKPSILWGTGFLTVFLNKDQIAEASKDFGKFSGAELNTKPLSYGPYYLDKQVNGESVLAKQNPYYYNKDKVKVKEIEFKAVSPAQAAAVIKNGDVDYIRALSPNIWGNVKDANNGSILGQTDLYVSYVGFKLGKLDKEKGKVVTNSNAKLADVKVRQAFGYAVDWDQINEKLFKGLRYTPTGSGFFPPRIELAENPNGKKYKKDVEKAKKLLDEAGFKDKDNDGIREDKNGNKVSFNFAVRNTGSDLDQALADNFIKSWKEVGLDVKLVDGKLLSAKDWSTRVQADDSEIDIFQGAWGFFNNPNPNYIAGETSKLNLPRYIDDKLIKDLEQIDSIDSFDDAKIKEAFNKFDEDFAAASPWLPLSWNTDIVWVNKRIKNLDLKKYNTFDQQFYELELTADKGVKN